MNVGCASTGIGIRRIRRYIITSLEHPQNILGQTSYMQKFRWCTPNIESGSELRNLSNNMMNKLYTKTTILICWTKSSIIDI